ncbi:MAG TPA: HK97 gp10 family phage protein [Bosea sp. (in: a-proteobacteria)]|uniref:HK97 gp10 family phage protein n=1 Tax=Bosea sp. (in: a-proteobacteria) TaxID=1871050 RepID=UPI002DDD771C|nr:HK97 gp10 family phage protein [Bosea sp. (in: a-proteobacteria)]HEV2552717.1 HK97 gp10 family phage protein [Bosea sp. (in: a-proteobacteria)]
MTPSAKRLTRRLAKVPIEIRAAAATEALLQAQRLAQVIALAAPADEGALRASIRVTVGKRGDRFYVRGGGPKTTRPVRAGQSATYDYANAIEHGTDKLKRRPFFYPTARAAKRFIRAGIAHEIRKAAEAFNGKGRE